MSDKPMTDTRTGQCVSCGKQTEWACADCAIDRKRTVYVCENPDCREKHAIATPEHAQWRTPRRKPMTDTRKPDPDDPETWRGIGDNDTRKPANLDYDGADGLGIGKPDTPAPAVPPAESGWYCPTCQREVPGRQVTNDERHEVCGDPVLPMETHTPAPSERSAEDRAREWIEANCRNNLRGYDHPCNSKQVFFAIEDAAKAFATYSAFDNTTLAAQLARVEKDNDDLTGANARWQDENEKLEAQLTQHLCENHRNGPPLPQGNEQHCWACLAEYNLQLAVNAQAQLQQAQTRITELEAERDRAQKEWGKMLVEAANSERERGEFEQLNSRLTAALSHQTYRNHEYAPSACSGCSQAAALLSPAGKEEQ